MSNEGIDRQQQKINEFLRLLPLTAAIAGLPECELGRYFNEGADGTPRREPAQRLQGGPAAHP